jgi:hypothetical protein
MEFMLGVWRQVFFSKGEGSEFTKGASPGFSVLSL